MDRVMPGQKFTAQNQITVAATIAATIHSATSNRLNPAVAKRATPRGVNGCQAVGCFSLVILKLTNFVSGKTHGFYMKFQDLDGQLKDDDCFFDLPTTPREEGLIAERPMMGELKARQVKAQMERSQRAQPRVIKVKKSKGL
jgi:hypothetical protein